MRGGDAGAGIVDLDAEGLAAAPGAEQDAAAVGILDGVRQQVLHDAAQELGVRAHDGRAADPPQAQALLAREGAELGLPGLYQPAQVHRRPARLFAARRPEARPFGKDGVGTRNLWW